jgi:hypothetical protein
MNSNISKIGSGVADGDSDESDNSDQKPLVKNARTAWRTGMADEKEFAKELNALIKR